MRRFRVVVASLVILLAAGACGGGGNATSSEAKRQLTTTSAPSATVADLQSMTPEQLAAEVARQAQTASPSGGSTPTTLFDPATHPLAPKNPQPMRNGQPRHPQADTVPVALQVDAPSCAKLGSSMRVTVTSEPDVDVAMIIGYSDDKAYESQSLGTTGPEGRLVLEIAISPEAPAGSAELLTVAGAPDGRRNHVERNLRIVNTTGSCS